MPLTPVEVIRRFVCDAKVKFKFNKLLYDLKRLITSQSTSPPTFPPSPPPYSQYDLTSSKPFPL